MEGFTLIDGVVALVIIVSAILAYARGFVREAMAIAGWIAAAVVAFLFAGTAEPLVKEIPYVGDYLRDSCELSIIAAFAAVFAVALVVVSLFTPLFASAVQRSALSGLDRGLGFFFGVLRGLLLVAVAFVVYDRVVVGEEVAMVADSRTAKIFDRVRGDIDEQIPEDAPSWIVQQYEKLVGNCTE
ncbi:CvpA family protein [Psychromarinibacter sp. C21-152]|uniref:CvpA family protein n=1 Tax=Psychromarinibacter sediminicola TaxID=3033385 RepID=A0AAE3NW20_9RHOB|nr:CvpA family protein [Psychromarinibacter sediminicola]MDF0602729.1 CvpA family protein [Psychromarinibacter sediminicola]